jgi:DNA mismatch repair protein MutL
MKGKIKELDSLTIDKIAAGEVIEASASCVKELVDNAVDSGATSIFVEIEAGGRERIVVQDNGCGMCEEDVLRSIRRHTTSKLSSIDDLFSISSRGFRGEALASITSVAKVLISSSMKEDNLAVTPGTILSVHGGAVQGCESALLLPGTKVVVESLFYNVPARRKFLKSPARDIKEIVKVIEMQAFSAPHIAFKLVADGDLVCSFDAQEDSKSYAKRAINVFSEHFRNNSTLISYQDGNFALDGVIASLQNTRNNRALQFLLVNNRPVTSPFISHTIKAACGASIESGRHPIFALSLQMDQNLLDINVHPQKREVRFANEEEVSRIVYQAVSEALFSVSASSFCSPSSCYESSPFSCMQPYERESLFESKEEIQEHVPTLLQEESVCLAVLGDMALIALSDVSASLFVLDLRGAMRAILFANLMKEANEVVLQDLLIPSVVDVDAKDYEIFLQGLPVLAELGFLLRSFGQNSFIVESIPAHLSNIDVSKYIVDIFNNGLLTSHRLIEEDYRKKLAHLQVASMKELRSPISREIAFEIFKQWKTIGMPKRAPDGSFCCASLTSEELKTSVVKGILSPCHM